jgi:tetratricopeptide (TPR) repeat protein
MKATRSAWWPESAILLLLLLMSRDQAGEARRTPTHHASCVRLGNLYVRGWKFSAAVDVLERVVALDPMDPKTFLNLVLACEGIGKPREALDAFRKAIALDPSYVRAQYNLGTLLLQTEDHQGALAPLREATRLDPKAAARSTIRP